MIYNIFTYYRDGDSILDSVDNCPSYMNGDQSDADSDGIGIRNIVCFTFYGHVCLSAKTFTLDIAFER